MVFLQKRGPFNKVLEFKEFSSSGIQLTYLRIGVESPESTPLFEIPYDESNKLNYPIIFSLNNDNFILTERDVLEFSNLSLNSLRFTFTNPKNPYLIVNVAYEEAD